MNLIGSNMKKGGKGCLKKCDMSSKNLKTTRIVKKKNFAQILRVVNSDDNSDQMATYFLQLTNTVSALTRFISRSRLIRSETILYEQRNEINYNPTPFEMHTQN